MKEVQKIEIKFEKFNSKYNRIWEQLTNISIFVLTTYISGYIIALSAIPKNVNNLLKFETVNYILLGMGIVIGIGYGILTTHLLDCRKQIRKIFDENNIA